MIGKAAPCSTAASPIRTARSCSSIAPRARQQRLPARVRRQHSTVTFEPRLDRPCSSPRTRRNEGVEDPRLTKIGDEYHMLYTAWSPGNIQVAMATTRNFFTWQRRGIVIPGPDNKDAALFPEKIGGRYVMFHRIPPAIWLAYSDDLITLGRLPEDHGPAAGQLGRAQDRRRRATAIDRSRLALHLPRRQQGSRLPPRRRPARPGRPDRGSSAGRKGSSSNRKNPGNAKATCRTSFSPAAPPRSMAARSSTTAAPTKSSPSPPPPSMTSSGTPSRVSALFNIRDRCATERERSLHFGRDDRCSGGRATKSRSFRA